MRAMASSLLSSVKNHPVLTASSVLLLFARPIFHMLLFFWPLIVSTVLGVLAVVSFGRQCDEQVTPTAESAQQSDIVAFESSQEEKISNVLMVGNQEVTWLEWLHHEDTRKFCAHECEPALCDADGCDGVLMSSEPGDVAPSSADASSCEHEVLDDASMLAQDEVRPYAWVSKGDGQMRVSALVSTEEDEMAAVALLPSTSLDAVKVKNIALALQDLNKEEAKMKAPIATVDGKSSTHVIPVCAEGNNDKTSVEEPCLTGASGIECKTIQGSAVHSMDEVSDYASADGDDVVGCISECTSKCNTITKSLASTPDINSTSNTCLSDSNTRLPLAVSKLDESGVHALEFPSVTEAISGTSEPKNAHTHEQDVLDLPLLNENISLLSEMKGAKVHEMKGTDEQAEEDKGSNQLGPQWDVSDGEEDRSSLRFSFFHNSFLSPSGA